jgi:hypothetical protein
MCPSVARQPVGCIQPYFPGTKLRMQKTSFTTASPQCSRRFAREIIAASAITVAAIAFFVVSREDSETQSVAADAPAATATSTR